MILLTGATGFVGNAILGQLPSDKVVVLGRSKPKGNLCKEFHFGNINESDSYEEALSSVDVVIHSAARAHVMDESSNDPLQAYREVNAHGTLNLANQCAEAGVKRFIFISTIKVNGESTKRGEPFRYNDVACPQDDYARSKAEAEAGLKKISQSTGMEIVIIRPPLVYGPEVKANFASLIELASKNLPLPLGSIYNKRSMVALGNLVDLILLCVEHTNAANQVFLVSDGDDLSTSQLLFKITESFGLKPRLLPFPTSILNFILIALGKRNIASRLTGSLEVDIAYTRETLGWTPPLSVEEGLRLCSNEKEVKSDY